MTTIKTFIERHSVRTYFALTFALSWGGLLIAVSPVGFFGSGEHELFPIALVANEAGPLLAGIVLTALVYGRVGLRSRLLRWRVSPRWYVLALLAGPLLVTPTLFASQAHS